jgi:ankyrin repeat protein
VHAHYPFKKDGESGWTPLHRALYFNNLRAAALLLDYGASLTVRSASFFRDQRSHFQRLSCLGHNLLIAVFCVRCLRAIPYPQHTLREMTQTTPL